MAVAMATAMAVGTAMVTATATAMVMATETATVTAAVVVVAAMAEAMGGGWWNTATTMMIVVSISLEELFACDGDALDAFGGGDRDATRVALVDYLARRLRTPIILSRVRGNVTI